MTEDRICNTKNMYKYTVGNEEQRTGDIQNTF